MSLFIAALASGSNGNCYYVGNETEAVLIDAGITCKEIETRMRRLNLSMHKVKAVLVSHEHTDHIKGLTILSKKYHLPVYITTSTLRNARTWLHKTLIRSFDSEIFTLGSLLIKPFTKLHDAIDPYSFTISYNGINVGIFTDIGTPCSKLIDHFSECHAAFLETNYDESMLMNGSYPYYLKKRISGERGHLSNHQALEIFLKYRASHLSHLILSHLSKNNNCPQLVKELFSSHSNGSQIVVASRYEETRLYRITESYEKHSFTQACTYPQQMELAF